MPNSRDVSLRIDAEDSERLHKLSERAQKGDQKALEEARRMLTDRDLWGRVGDLARYARDAWLEAATGPHALPREGMERRVAELRGELLADGDSPLERILVDRVVACWFQATYADWQHGAAVKSGKYTVADDRFHQDRQDRSHRRLLQAVKALATVRRLLVPAVQVNIGRSQIISQSSPAVANQEPSA